MKRANGGPRPTRRGLVRAVAGYAAVAGARLDVGTLAGARGGSEPFHAPHQAGIATPPQRHTYLAAFDLVASRRDDVIALLRAWTTTAAQMAGAATATAPAGIGAGRVAPGRLTLTFGFGPGLFVKDGKDRYALAAHRPPALVDLRPFDGDELIEDRTGGDLSVQACADDLQAPFDAVRALTRLAGGAAEMRWAQTGFLPASDPLHQPRNLMGFRDGTNNLSVDDAAAMARFVWVGGEGPYWMRNGSYVIFRRIRIALEHWDRMPLAFQEQTFGRHKRSGAPLGARDERDPADLNANGGSDGDPVIPESAHIRLAAAASNDGARILRRGYSYNDGVGYIVERWPPWHRGNMFDAGLLFVCYQRDPRTGFIRIFERLSKSDMLNQFVTHTGGGIFACPGGVAPGEFIGQRLFVPS